MTAAGRVLIVGPSKVGDMAWFLALAYRRLGWQVACFDDRAYLSRGLRGKAATAVQVAEREYHLSRRSRRLGEVTSQRARGCDHVVAVKGEYFLPQDVEQIAAQAPIINWHPDHPMLTQSFDCVPHYTAFCPKDSWTTQRLRTMGYTNVLTLPHASDPEVLGGPRSDPDLPSFSVVGNGYPYRRHWIREAIKSGLWLHGWGAAAAGLDFHVASSNGPAVGAAQGVALRTGYFTLNTHHPFDIAGGNQRVFDAAAAGAPQLTEHLPETIRHFKPGCEIATFDSYEEFCSLVRELSCSSERRTKLALNSHERLRDEHTYEHRVQTILGLVG